VTYVRLNDQIWELDGRLKGPVNKGKIEQEAHLGIEVSKIIRKYIELSGDAEIQFSVMALAPDNGDLDLS